MSDNEKNINIDEEDIREEENTDEENNPDIDPELTKIDENLLSEKEDYDKIQPVDLKNEMRTSFLSYAMSVIVSRALPDVRILK